MFRPRKKKSAEPGAKKPGAIRRIIKWLLIFVLCVAVPLGIGAAAGVWIAFSRTVPSVHEVKADTVMEGTRIYADDETVVGEIRTIKGHYIPLDKIPQELINAVVAVEDSKFWTHSGVDYLAIARAAVANLRARHITQGASTITQQLVKNTILTPERTFSRKMKELVLAHRIEKSMTKEEILELYLNRAYFGHGAYGVDVAAKTYFGHGAGSVTLPEAAILAGLLKSPSNYSPFKDPKAAKERQSIVLTRMEEEGLISRDQHIAALKTPVYLTTESDLSDSNQYFLDYVQQYLESRYDHDAIYRSGLSVHTSLRPKMQGEAQRALQAGLRALDKRRGFRGPVRHVDPAAMDSDIETQTIRTRPLAADDIVRAAVVEVKPGGASAVLRTDAVTGTLSVKDAEWAGKRFDEASGDIVPVGNFSLSKILKPGDIVWVQVKKIDAQGAVFALDQDPLVEGAVVSIDPRTGYIQALVGGFDYRKSQFNRATRATRQAGSSFKPVIYAVALAPEHGFTPASVIVDEEVKYNDNETDKGEDIDGKSTEKKPKEPRLGPDGQPLPEVWMPQNYDGKHHGPTRLRIALAFSRNVISVKLVDAIGMRPIINFARSIGITSEMPRDLTLALGSVSLSPLELISAYSAFANEGVRVPSTGVKFITDKRGKVLETNTPKGERVMDEKVAYLLTSMLKDTVAYGTAQRAKALKRPAAAKTGTTNEFRDAWFIGYTTDLLTGVWVGFDEPKTLGAEETGGRAAAPIWVDYMLAVDQGTNEDDFPMPDGIVRRIIDRETGLLAGPWTKDPMLEYFIEGTEPTERSKSLLDDGGNNSIFK